MAKRSGLAERRGFRGEIETDANLCALLVRADIEEAAGSFAQAIKAKQWKKGVPRGKMPRKWFDGRNYCLYQLRGHPWTTIQHEYDKSAFTEQVAKDLSAALGSRVIFAGSQNTAGVVWCCLYDSGRLAEVFFLHDEKSETFHTLTDAEFAHVEKNGFSKVPYGYFCASRVREISEARCRGLCGCESGDESIVKLNRIIDDFFKSQDAYLAFPNSEYFTLARDADSDFVRLDLVEA
jgi:hypothetical protein